MDTAVEVGYGVAELLFGPNSLVPWWAWLAPVAMIFLRLLAPVLFPEVAEARWGSDSDIERARQSRNSKKSNKATKSKKK
ncbi:hypothetical protein GCM10010112_54560 [Actinoplanes lobatus]|uniref:Uncharacterized protein n=1 Tax=Actinoplanes lobatus TaxID=113568 RepID=A0A7W7MGU5_9ACTN|nr:hypothetical protein [Actinoplanes lobatus]MBB4749325.1 hypothetical protein [Actinoplanes lobatus]GGN79673.1 hypothetical protein GCM10010112_54560 [Actinoplanes lobatus]GIE40264.1 hypothetical protein Alo02nite_31620 [Actinoplanes lobatus]